MHKPLMILTALAGALALTACQAPEAEHSANGWPDGLMTPIADVTFSMSPAHLPGPPLSASDRPRQGFSFVNGHAGRPLMPAEAVVAVAAGEIVRIDHDHPEQNADLHNHWLALESEPGFLGAHARDQLLGRQIWLRHPSGHLSRYAQLSEVHPQLMPGDSVEQGQIIGLVGAVGIAAGESAPESVPPLHFQLWSSDSSHYLGQNLTAFETHRQIATIFSENALPRFARRTIAQVEAGRSNPDQYLLDPLPDKEFEVDLPSAVTVGRAFAAGITWEDDVFEPNDLFGLLDGHPLGTLEAPDGVWVVGAAPLNAHKELELIIGAIDAYGRTLTGSRSITLVTPDQQHLPREVDPAVLALYTEQNQAEETEHLAAISMASLQQTQPQWQQPFTAPLEGEVLAQFGQSMFHGMLLPTHPAPGMLITPDDNPTVHASNNGMVGFAGPLPIRGNTVALIHGGGVVSVYSHLDEIMVKAGDRLNRNDPLGVAGQSGAVSTSRQVGWEIHIAGTPTDPLLWLDRVLPDR